MLVKWYAGLGVLRPHSPFLVGTTADELKVEALTSQQYQPSHWPVIQGITQVWCRGQHVGNYHGVIARVDDWRDSGKVVFDLPAYQQSRRVVVDRMAVALGNRLEDVMAARNIPADAEQNISHVNDQIRFSWPILDLPIDVYEGFFDLDLFEPV